jgi:hypothetical protein
MPLANIPGIFSSGQPVASGSTTSGQSPAHTSVKNVALYTSGCSSAGEAKTTALDPKKPTQDSRDSKIASLISIAKGEIGVIEDAGTDNKGAGIEKYWAATNKLGSSSGYSAGWHWCAAFVSWCIKEAGLFDENIRPKEIAALGFGNLAPTKGNWRDQRGGKDYSIIIHSPKQEDLQAGDLIVFTNSHVGVIAEPWSGDSYTTIEGNTSSDDKNVGAEIVDRDGIGVFMKKRKTVAKIKSIIRLYPDGIPQTSDKNAIAST